MIPRAFKIIERIKSQKKFFFYFCTRIEHRDEWKYIDGTTGKKNQTIKPRTLGWREDKNDFISCFDSLRTRLNPWKNVDSDFRLIRRMRGLKTTAENYSRRTHPS